MNKRQLADRLRTLREEQQLTQPELARKVLVGQSQVSRWENATALPSAPKIGKLAEALGVEVAEMFRWVLEASQEDLREVRRDRYDLVQKLEEYADRMGPLLTRFESMFAQLEDRSDVPSPPEPPRSESLRRGRAP